MKFSVILVCAHQNELNAWRSCVLNLLSSLFVFYCGRPFAEILEHSS